MKKLETILAQKPVFLNNWGSKEDVVASFEDIYLSYGAAHNNMAKYLVKKESIQKAIEKYKDVNILFASYGTDNYEGAAWVLFEQAGKLYEVNGQHCSCFGLEEQWSPEEVHLETLVHRLQLGKLGTDDYTGNLFKQELCEFLGVGCVQLDTKGGN